MTLPLPDTIGRFKIESRLGSGGMGDVYRAQDPTLRRTVAIKTVRPDIDNPMYLDRLYREAQAIARLQHPNIVTVFEAGEMGGLVYIAMEFLKGENLAAALDRGDLTFEAKVKIVMQILEALQYAHSEGVIHRDIKPANVHRLPDGSVKLLDFGLARMTRAESLTQSGAVMGTPFYASPEQLRGELVDGRTDVYSAGVLAYELFTGRRAFEGDNLSTVIVKVLSTPPPPMATSWANTFPEIERIVSRAMAKDAADRYATAEDMRTALAAFLAASREGLASLQAEQTIVAQRAVQEAKTLIASGSVGHARELLAETVRLHPEAAAARTLLKETGGGIANEPTLVRPPSAAGAATRPASAPATNAATQPAPLPAAPRPAAPAPSPLLPPPPVRPSPVANADRPSGSRRTAAMFVAAAVLVMAVVAGWMLSRGTASPVVRTNPPPPPVSAPTPPDRVAKNEPAPAPPTQTDPAAEPRPAEKAVTKDAKADTKDTKSVKPAAPEKIDSKTPPAPPEPPPAPKDPAPVPPTVDASAKKLFSDSASRNPGLRYRIVQLRADDTEADVDPDTTFHSGDRVRFTFEPNIDGYLYVVQEGSSGRWNMLFPNPQINGGINAVQHGKTVSIPSQGWFKFDTSAGTERAFVFLSKEPLTSLPGFKEPVTKMESVGASVVDDLKRSVQSRDLVFEKDTGSRGRSTFVVNRDELGKFVSATIQLVHQ